MLTRSVVVTKRLRLDALVVSAADAHVKLQVNFLLFVRGEELGTSVRILWYEMRISGLGNEVDLAGGARRDCLSWAR